MRIKIAHDIEFAFEQPARNVLMALKLMPRDHEGQQVLSWRIEPSVDGRLRSSHDGFGNLMHLFQAEGPMDGLALRVTGLVETIDTTGTVRSAQEKVPPPVYLRQTALTQPDEAVSDLARQAGRAAGDPLGRAHALMAMVHERLAGEPERPDQPRSAAEIARAESGSPLDQAHLFCSAARVLEIPARVISGHVAGGDARTSQGVHHWAEAHLPGLGWVGFDSARCLCPSVSHVRLAAGLEGPDVAPFRLTRSGGWGETLTQIVASQALPLQQ